MIAHWQEFTPWVEFSPTANCGGKGGTKGPCPGVKEAKVIHAKSAANVKKITAVIKKSQSDLKKAQAEHSKNAVVLAKVKADKEAGKKPVKKRAVVPVDKDIVDKHVGKLMDALEKSRTPKGLSGLDHAAAMQGLDKRSMAELKTISKAVGTYKVPTTKSGALKGIHDKLLEVERARESIQV